MFLYLITNKINGKKYVGQTVNPIKLRWRQHIANSNSPKRSGALWSAIKKYGPENFEIKVLAKASSLEEMNHRETYYIHLLNTISPNGYNVDSGGKNKIMHPDTKKKISLAKLGKKPSPFSEEHKRKISESNKGKNKGIPLSEQTKRKISEANRGEKHPFFGKKQTEKNKLATSKANKGNTYWLGKKHSQESKNKISVSKIGVFIGNKNPFFGKKHSEESLKKMSEANNKTKIKVYCVNNNTTYSSINEASKVLGIHRHSIKRVMYGIQSQTEGFVFKKA